MLREEEKHTKLWIITTSFCWSQTLQIVSFFADLLFVKLAGTLIFFIIVVIIIFAFVKVGNFCLICQCLPKIRAEVSFS